MVGMSITPCVHVQKSSAGEVTVTYSHHSGTKLQKRSHDFHQVKGPGAKIALNDHLYVGKR